jgi:hypothetical protein
LLDDVVFVAMSGMAPAGVPPTTGRVTAGFVFAAVLVFPTVVVFLTVVIFPVGFAGTDCFALRALSAADHPAGRIVLGVGPPVAC